MRVTVMISSISYIKNNVSKTFPLWGSMLLTLSLVVVSLFAFEVPQNIQTGLNAHAVSRELHNMRFPFIEARAAMLTNKVKSGTYTYTTIVESCGNVTSCVDAYEKAAAYNKALNKFVVDFKIAFKRWIKSVKGYEYQLTQIPNQLSGHVNNRELKVKEAENNVLFIEMIQQLNSGEKLINQDLEKGQQAFEILQGVTLLIIIYFFIVIILYQRRSNRKHILREKNLEVTLRSIADAVIATDIHGNITSMNPEAEHLTGWKFEDANGFALSKIFRMKNGHAGESADDLLERVKLGKNVVVLAEDSMLITSKGDRYHIHESGAPIHNDCGEIIGVVLVFTDITQEHDLKNQLDDHAKRLQGVIDTSMDCVIVIDEFGMVKEWNPAAESMFGWSFEEISQKPLHETIIPEEFRERHLSGIERLIKQNQPSARAKRIESIALHHDGHRFPIELAMTAICTENGWVFNAFIRDLTDIKNNENIIKKNDVLLRGGQRAAKLGYWELDLVDDTLEWSSEIFRIFSLDPDTVKPSYEIFISKVHPEDRDRVDIAYSELLKNKTPYNIIHRIETDEGTKIVHEQCETIFDDKGKPVRSLGMVHDITELKQAEEDLQQFNRVIDCSPAVLFRWKAIDGWPVEFVSENVNQFGYTAEELLSGNVTFNSIVHPDDLERVTHELEEYSSAGIDVFAQEYRIVSPTGKVYWIDDRTVVDRDSDGAIVRYQGIVLDISGRVANNKGVGAVSGGHVQGKGLTDIVTQGSD